MQCRSAGAGAGANAGVDAGAGAGDPSVRTAAGASALSSKSCGHFLCNTQLPSCGAQPSSSSHLALRVYQ